jgi:hypothetical protein
MWGHVFENAIGVYIKWPWEENEEISIRKCKHCGEIKP